MCTCFNPKASFKLLELLAIGIPTLCAFFLWPPQLMLLPIRPHIDSLHFPLLSHPHPTFLFPKRIA